MVSILNTELASSNLTAFSQLDNVNLDPCLVVTLSKAKIADDDQSFTRELDIIYHNTITTSSTWSTDMHNHVDAIYDALKNIHNNSNIFRFTGWDISTGDNAITVSFSIETIA